MHVRQCRAQMGGHVFRSLIVMLKAIPVFGRDSREIGLAIRAGRGRRGFPV
ncbi:hypothetical protein EP837_02680 [Sphingobium sp. EP60837]|nr:hypothetical protein EP837_02680 [Sphingobium sp. EP60837]